jgi:hypothetical protein
MRFSLRLQDSKKKMKSNLCQRRVNMFPNVRNMNRTEIETFTSMHSSHQRLILDQSGRRDVELSSNVMVSTTSAYGSIMIATQSQCYSMKRAIAGAKLVV